MCAAPIDESGSDEEGGGGDGGDVAMEVEDDSVHAFEGHTGAALLGGLLFSVYSALSPTEALAACSAGRFHSASVVRTEHWVPQPPVMGASKGGRAAPRAVIAVADIRTATCRADTVFAVAWSPTDAKLVATGGADDAAFMWRVRTVTTCVEVAHLLAEASMELSSQPNPGLQAMAASKNI